MKKHSIGQSLSLAYYNLAVEYEHMEELNRALKYYQKVNECLEKLYGTHSSFGITVANCISQVERKLLSKQYLHFSRKQARNLKNTMIQFRQNASIYPSKQQG